MKKIYALLLMIATFFICWPASNCDATDIWVCHSSYEDIDVFLMDDTLIHGINENGRYFKVMWEYEKSKYASDPWRYETSTMTHDHTCIVHVYDYLFEYCMNWLGWNYTIREFWYI